MLCVKFCCQSGICAPSRNCLLKQLDTYDTFCCSDPVKVTADVLPSGLMLLRNFLNPFHPETTIKSGLPEEALITITFYYVTGKKIPTFLNTLPEACCHISWLNTVIPAFPQVYTSYGLRHRAAGALSYEETGYPLANETPAGRARGLSNKIPAVMPAAQQDNSQACP